MVKLYIKTCKFINRCQIGEDSNILSNQLCAMWYLFNFGLRNRFIDVCGSFSKKKKALIA